MTIGKEVELGDELEINLEAMAESIEKLSKIGEKLSDSRLKKRTLILLIKDITGVKISDIRLILDALPKLRGIHLKPETSSVEYEKEGE